MTHPPDVKGTNVERAQTPSGPILAPSMTDAELRITAKMLRESSIIFIVVCLLQASFNPLNGCYLRVKNDVGSIPEKVLQSNTYYNSLMVLPFHDGQSSVLQVGFSLPVYCTVASFFSVTSFWGSLGSSEHSACVSWTRQKVTTLR